MKTKQSLFAILLGLSFTFSAFSQPRPGPVTPGGPPVVIGGGGGIRTTNLPFAGAVLLTDGTIYYWGYTTNLAASTTNAIRAVFTNGVAVVATSGTNIDFISSSTISILATNNPAGKASLQFNLVGGAGGSNVFQPNILFVATNGNDSTAVKGWPHLAWATVTNAIRSATNGDTVIIAPGTYYAHGFSNEINWSFAAKRTNSPIPIGSVTNLTIRGSGRGTKIKSSFPGPIFTVFQTEGLTMENFLIEGAGTNLNNTGTASLLWTNTFGAIVLYDAPGSVVSPGFTNKNVTLNNLWLEYIPDHGIMNIPSVETEGLTISDCQFRYGGDAFHSSLVTDGTAIEGGARGIKVTGCLFDNWDKAFELYSEYGAFNNVNFSGNTAVNCWRSTIWIIPKQGADPDEYRSIVINGNVLGMPTGFAVAGATYLYNVWVTGGKGVIISDNTILCSPESTSAGIFFDAATPIRDSSINHNWIWGAVAYGISVQNTTTTNATGVVIENNNLLRSGGAGFASIYVAASDTKILNNTIRDNNGTQPGIWINKDKLSSTNNIISGNQFDDMGGTNILISATVTNTYVGLNFAGPTAPYKLHDLGVNTTKIAPWSTGFGPLVTGTADGTKFVKDDGTLAVPAAVASSNYTTLASGSATLGSLFSTNLAEFYSGYTSGGPSTNDDALYLNDTLNQGSTSVAYLGIIRAPSIRATNDATFTGNTIHEGTNIISGVLRMPAIATNRYLFLDGNSNVVGVASVGGSGGTNYPPIINQYTVASSTNIDVSGGVRRKLLYVTNANFGVNLSGTAPSGFDLFLAFSNSSSSTIYVSNYVASTLTGFFDYSTASNNTAHAIPANSMAFITLNHVTNGYWWRVSMSQKEMELRVANAGGVPFLVSLTNADGSIMTLSNSYPPQASSMVASNIVGLASTVFTNVPLGGTNISVRTAGGTNFIDTTGQLNNWSQIPTGQVVNITGAQNITGTKSFATIQITNFFFQATNSNPVLVKAALSNSIPITNIVGLIHKASAATLFADANDAHNFTVTNRITAATTIVLTNTSDGQELTIVVPGEVSGGTSRTLTIIGNGGGSAAIANLDTFGTAIAASMALTLTNGNAVEISARTTRMLQSNVTAVVTRQFSF